ncbi:MAG UNVERIFIED_CONTAM: hypothetical protein LVR29_34565 [Microcystis novacekii LVE1205-3]
MGNFSTTRQKIQDIVMAIDSVIGSAGLIGSESVRFFCDWGYTVVGIDNNMRQVFFGERRFNGVESSQIIPRLRDKYIHHAVDIRES